jgi:hypothetical protein
MNHPLRIVLFAVVLVGVGIALFLGNERSSVVRSGAPRDDAARVPVRAVDSASTAKPVDGKDAPSPSSTGERESTSESSARSSSTMEGDTPAARSPAFVASRLEAIAQVAAAARAAALARGSAPTAHPPDRDGIRASMRDAVPKLKECYEPWLALNPELQGSLSASFVIGPDGGTPHEVGVVEGGLGSDVLDGCVLSVIEGEMRFARSPNGEPVRVTYPLRFASEAAEAPSTTP